MSTLAHRVVGGGPRTAYVLHGILGAGRNWLGMVRRMHARWAGWRFVLVDQRCHGESRDRPGPHTLEACVDDLLALTAVAGAPQLVVGHSFGGKVALCYGRRGHAELEQVWSLDALPSAGTPQDADEVARVIRALRSVPQPLSTRAELLRLLAADGFAPNIGAWMTTNLRRVDSGLIWRFDLDGVEELLADYFRVDLWRWMDHAEVEVHLLQAAGSDRWRPEVMARLAATGPAVRHHRLEDAGHWVHVDNPDGLLDLLDEGFAR